MRIQYFILIATILCFGFCTSETKEFYVSPSGHDGNPGTKDRPFLSFNKAKEAVADALSPGKEGRNIHVYFRGGVYLFEETVFIKEGEFANKNQKVVFSAYKGEKPVFSAGKKLTGWEKITSGLPYLPEEAQGKVWVVKIPPTGQRSIARFLCDDSGPLPNSVSSGIYTQEDDGVRMVNNDFNLSAEQLSFFVFPKPFFREWENLVDIEIITRPHYGWAMNVLPLMSIDMQKGVAYTAIPATYKICKLRGYERPNLWVQNAIDYLDKPGEWVINSSAGKIYYWPRGEKPGEVYYPALQEIIRVEGNKEDGKIIKDIEFRGITFSHANRDTWGKSDIGLQHDWAIYNNPDALLRFVDAENCTVDHCTFTNSGGGGVRFDLHSQNNRIINCKFSQLGGVSILLAGYGPGNEDVNKNNSVINNEINECGQIYWHSPGIFIWQSGGNRIANNLICNMPYTGIVVSGPRPQFFNTSMGDRREISGTVNFSGIEDFDVNSEDRFEFEPYINSWDKMFKYLHARNNVIEYNELHHTAMKIDDGNGIYLSGTGYNNIVRRNYIHDNISSCLHGIIRADDQAKDVTITENIIYRYTGEGIKIKHPCSVINNYIIDWIPSEWPNGKKTAMHEFLNVSPAGPIKGSVIKNNICYQSCGITQPFFNMSIYYPLGKLTKPSDIDMDNNLYFAVGVFHDCISQLEEQKNKGIDRNSVVADPLFEGFEEAGFKLKDDSPAHQLQIKQIDFENIGLLKNSVK